MAIVNYPNRVRKQSVPAIDRTMAKRKIQLVRGSKDLTSTALDAVISSNNDWQLDSIKFSFSNATARNFSAKILGGRKVVTELNDYLWFQSNLTMPQQITLDAGFYTGTELATQLKTQLDANVEFLADSVTFTVAYSATTGLFTITPSSGTLKYFNINTMTTQRYRDSIAANLFGFTTDSTFGATVVSDIPAFGLDQEAWIIDETGSVVLSNYFDDIKLLNIDQALHLETNVASVTVDYEVGYEELI